MLSKEIPTKEKHDAICAITPENMMYAIASY